MSTSNQNIKAGPKLFDTYAMTWRMPIIVWQFLFFVGPLVFMIAMSFFLVKNYRMEEAFEMKAVDQSSFIVVALQQPRKLEKKGSFYATFGPSPPVACLECDSRTNSLSPLTRGNRHGRKKEKERLSLLRGQRRREGQLI